MLALKDVLIVAGVVLLAAAVGITLYDLWKVLDYPRKLARIAAAGEAATGTPEEPRPVRWRTPPYWLCCGVSAMAGGRQHRW